jgi:BASS family bile acid:Na+ symporter
MERIFLVSLAVTLPIGMFLLGLHIKAGEFREALARPRAVVAGLFCQLVLLPALALLFISFYPVSLPLKVGVAIIAATPGGPASNTITYLGRGNLPLAILLTATTSVVGVLTIPLYVNAGLSFLDLDRVSHLPVIPTIVRSVVLVLLPVAGGVALRAKKPEFAAKTERFTQAFTSFLVVVLLAAGVVSHWDVFRDNFGFVVVGGVLLFSACLTLGAFYTGRLFGLSPRDRYTVAVEAVVHNAILALLVVTVVDVREAIVFAAYFGVFSILVGVLLTGVLRPGGLLNREAPGPALEPTDAPVAVASTRNQRS